MVLVRPLRSDLPSTIWCNLLAIPVSDVLRLDNAQMTAVLSNTNSSDAGEATRDDAQMTAVLSNTNSSDAGEATRDDAAYLH